MSQKSSLPQPTQSVSRVLTADSQRIFLMPPAPLVWWSLAPKTIDQCTARSKPRSKPYGSDGSRWLSQHPRCGVAQKFLAFRVSNPPTRLVRPLKT
jgi:hypothetical protein